MEGLFMNESSGVRTKANCYTTIAGVYTTFIDNKKRNIFKWRRTILSSLMTRHHRHLHSQLNQLNLRRRH
jgi:hypothetical protein